MLSLIHQRHPGAVVIRATEARTLKRQIKRAQFFHANGIKTVFYIENLDAVYNRYDADTLAEMLEGIVVHEKETDEGAGNQAD